MSNLNEQDIAKYHDDRYHENVPRDYVEDYRELFQVELCTIEDYDKDGNLIDAKEWYCVVNRLIPEQTYPCRNKETAENLCDYMNVIAEEHDLTLDLPQKLSICLNDDFIRLADRINDKQDLLEELQIAKSHELTFELDYLHKCNDIKLHPDIVKDKLDLSKNPTEKQITAYCEETYSTELMNWKVSKTKVSLLNKQLELLEDRISFEKYQIRSEL